MIPAGSDTSYRILTGQQIDRHAWGTLVDKSRTATWFQTPEAYGFFASVPELLPFVHAVVRQTGEDEKLCGVCVGYLTQDSNAFRQFFTRRAIIIGGPCLADDCTCAEAEMLMRAVRSGKPADAPMHARVPIYIETRNFHDYSAWRPAFEAAGFIYQPHYDLHTDCSDRAAMTARVADSTMRQVRKALAEGAHVVTAKTDEDIQAFYRMLHELYDKKVRKPLFSLLFFKRFVHQEHGVLLLVKKPMADKAATEELIGGMLCAILPGRVLYEWYVVGQAVVTWAAMDYANNHGLPLFDLMGAGVPGKPYGVRDFKLRFGGQLHDFGRYLHINNRLLYAIGKGYMEAVQRKK